MNIKRYAIHFLLGISLVFTPLAANASCPSGQVKRLDKKIDKKYIIARWEGGEYAPCKYIGRTKPSSTWSGSLQKYKCGSMPVLAAYETDRGLVKVISKEGVIIDTQFLKNDWERGSFGFLYTNGKVLEEVEATERQIDPLTRQIRLVRDYILISSPELPKNIEQRKAMDIYIKYKCLNVSF